MGKNCANCGGWVSDAFARVAKTNDQGQPVACMACGQNVSSLEGKTYEDTNSQIPDYRRADHG